MLAWGVLAAVGIAGLAAANQLAYRFRLALRPRVMRHLERVGGAVLVAFGLRLAAEAR